MSTVFLRERRGQTNGRRGQVAFDSGYLTRSSKAILKIFLFIIYILSMIGVVVTHHSSKVVSPAHIWYRGPFEFLFVLPCERGTIHPVRRCKVNIEKRNEGHLLYKVFSKMIDFLTFLGGHFWWTLWSKGQDDLCCKCTYNLARTVGKAWNSSMVRGLSFSFNLLFPSAW